MRGSLNLALIVLLSFFGSFSTKRYKSVSLSITSTMICTFCVSKLVFCATIVKILIPIPKSDVFIIVSYCPNVEFSTNDFGILPSK